MKGTIEERTLQAATYIVNHNATIRETANALGVSKSTVHRDLVERLPNLYPQMYQYVKTIIDVNLAERAFRGGQATQMKRQMMRTLKPAKVA
jgi:putative DeoR family transcriptional regulator (stage III sporulation protein D)